MTPYIQVGFYLKDLIIKKTFTHENTLEIEFDNNETMSCKNNQTWIESVEDSQQESNNFLNLTCWKHVDYNLIGNKETSKTQF